MAVDRGELRYSLIAQDRFKGTFRRFRKEIDDARKALDRLTASRARATAPTSRRGLSANQLQARVNQRIAREQAAARREEAQSLRDLNARLKAKAAQEKELGRITRQANTDRRNAAAAQRRALAQAEVVNRKATEAARVRRREFVGLNRQGNRLLFTFRRLVGALAAFALARQAAGGFRDLVAEGVRFNAELAQSRAGFAGIIASAGRITDQTGQMVTGQAAFNAALDAGARVQRRLLVRSLETTATVSELGVAFQQAVGPGLSRGLGIDQIADLSVLISQAATSIGLSQQQLAEETRSILSGTARAQTTRLAALFGGAAELNTLVRTAETGTVLFNELTNRLGGTAEAARRIANEIPGLSNRIKGAFEVVAGAASVDFTASIRSTLQGVLDLLLQVNEQTGLLEPKPQVLAAFAVIFDALDRILSRFTDLAGNIGFDGLVQGASFVAAALEVAASAIIGLVRGAREAFGILSAMAAPVIDIAAAFGLTDGSVTDTTESVARLIGFLAIARTAVFLMAGGFARVAAIASFLSGPLVLVLNLIGKIPARLFQAVAVFAALLVAAQKISSEILRIDLSLKDLPEVFGILVEQVATKAIGLGATIFTTVRNFAVLAFGEIITAARNAVTRLKALFDLELGASDQLSRLAAAERENEIGARNLQQRQLAKRLEQDLILAKQQQAQIEDDANRKAGDRVAKLEAEIKKRQEAAAAGAAGEGAAAPIAIDDSDIEARAKELLEKFRAAFSEAQQGEGGLEFDIGARDTQVTDELRAQVLQAKQKAELAQQELGIKQQLFRINQADGTAAEAALAAARGKVATLIIERQQRIQSAALAEGELQRELLSVNGVAAKAAVQARINALRETEGAAVQATTVEIELQRQKVEQLAQLIDTGLTGGVVNFAAGFAQGLRGFAERFASAFQAGVQIAQGIMQRFSSFVSDSIVDALDPTTDTDLLERFGRFLQDVARLILQQLVQLAIAKAILGLGIGGPGVGGLAGGGSVPSFAEGGNVPGGPSYESRPPPGAPKTDTVLARLTPGEWVDPVSTVARMGSDFFAALRAGAGDPMALRALVGLGGRSKAKASGRSGPFFQSGGLVSEQLRQAREASERADASRSRNGGSGGGGGDVLPILPANNSTMERLLAGGKGAMLNFMRKNAGDTGNRPRK